jgi:HAE1 family hydrophobic/amphiphilic exporter-1
LKNSILIKEKNVVGGTQEVLSQAEISHLLRVASDGVYTDRWVEDKYEYPMTLQMDKKRFNSVESLQSLPVGFEGKIVPLSALVDFELRPTPPNKFREDQRELTILTGTLTRAQKSEAKPRVLAVEELIQKFQVKQNGVSVQKVAPDKEITEAVRQLIIAISISMLLVFFTMVFQLGDVIQTLLVLVAIPAGFIGVVLSLWMFRSSLSLNSGLGTILLNGIAVANSIILVDFIHKKFQLGLKALDATVEASVARLRPILMTSLTTILGMLPMALGFGEGGKILQPLGIAVAGGLWISMLLTLFFVPTLQYLYLKRREKL